MIDFIEGLFLGRLWSDTDFENKRHIALLVCYGMLVDIFATLILFWKRYYFGIGKSNLIVAFFLLLLFLVCPFINSPYYRFPIWGKILVLFEKLIKNFLIFSITVRMMVFIIQSFMLATMKIKPGNLKASAINYANEHVSQYMARFGNGNSAFSTISGIIIGGITMVFGLVIRLAILIAIPIMIYLVIRLLQYCYDSFIEKNIIKKFGKK